MYYQMWPFSNQIYQYWVRSMIIFNNDINGRTSINNELMIIKCAYRHFYFCAPIKMYNIEILFLPSCKNKLAEMKVYILYKTLFRQFFINEYHIYLNIFNFGVWYYILHYNNFNIFNEFNIFVYQYYLEYLLLVKN